MNKQQQSDKLSGKEYAVALFWIFVIGLAIEVFYHVR